MGRVMYKEVHIQKSCNIADQRGLRRFEQIERIYKHWMTRRVWMEKVSGMWVRSCSRSSQEKLQNAFLARSWTEYTEVRLDGWCEYGLGQNRDGGGGRTTVRIGQEGVESPAAACNLMRAYMMAVLFYD